MNEESLCLRDAHYLLLFLLKSREQKVWNYGSSLFLFACGVPVVLRWEIFKKPYLVSKWTDWRGKVGAFPTLVSFSSLCPKQLSLCASWGCKQRVKLKYLFLNSWEALLRHCKGSENSSFIMGDVNWEWRPDSDSFKYLDWNSHKEVRLRPNESTIIPQLGRLVANRDHMIVKVEWRISTKGRIAVFFHKKF